MDVLIIEDEKRTAQRLEKLLAQYDPTIQVLAQLPGVAKAVAWLADPANPKPELVFLDIHLEDGSGFQIIEQAQLTLPIIFTTAFDEYTLQAFKTNSIDYLLKPMDADELGAALDKFKRLRSTPAPDLSPLLQLLGQTPGLGMGNTYKDRFMVTIGTKIRSIETSDIAYFFFADKSSWITTREGLNISIEYSLDKLSEMLDPKRFFRVNRAFLVSLDSIHTIHAYSGGKLKLDLRPEPRLEVFVSGDRITPFKEWLGK
ncbi:LytR/AlgR family response regulator transcription factor [Persicitalea jodogahamensis]|uniref:DNA-binding response regulator n=1 Tax=Persicitalea jodogahamensis TaxID=402147 RepID=A0A8J3D2M9_9BACT|nr:LytTR family DNA-binding domain-containing protein [Persicitalea jodogahamensis]GHB61670.1 DNA-binding response regulator [Persicitalea jodogahamensis]